MTVDLQGLRIGPAELAELTGLEVGAVFMGGMVRPSVWRSPRRILALVVAEGLVLGTAFVVGLGLALVLARQRPGFERLGGLALGVAGLVVLGAIAWHSYQGHRARRFATLARLLEECDRHNAIVQALQVAVDLAVAQGCSIPPAAAVITALQTTRHTLTTALATETVLRRHRAIIQRSPDLVVALETNLATLHSLQVDHQASEYRQLLQSALEIGQLVQQELCPSPDVDR